MGSRTTTTTPTLGRRSERRLKYTLCRSSNAPLTRTSKAVSTLEFREPLPVPSSVDPRNARGRGGPNSIFQTQIPNPTCCHILRRCPSSHRCSRPRTGRSLPAITATTRGINHIVDALHGHAKEQETKVDRQKVQRDRMQYQRVAEAAALQAAAEANPTATADVNIVPPLQVEYPATTSARLDHPTIISQDSHTPFQNTRASRSRRLVAVMAGTGLNITTAQASAQRYPLEFMTGFACAVLDAETGNLVEY